MIKRDKQFSCAVCVSACLIAVCVRTNRRKSKQAEREYEKVKHQLENLEESVRDRCKKEFTGTHSHLEAVKSHAWRTLGELVLFYWTRAERFFNFVIT